MGITGTYKNIIHSFKKIRCSSYSYYISVSLDQKNWRTIIDYSRISCRSDQVLFFNQQMTQYIKIVGTQNTINSVRLQNALTYLICFFFIQEFHIISFEAYFKNNVPTTTNGIICPNYNVATLDKKALVIKG